MKPKDAAGRMTLMDDAVRIPLAAKMKERALAAILAQMPAEDAKALTEKLAGRNNGAQTLADARNAINPPANAPAPNAQANNASPADAQVPAGRPGYACGAPRTAKAKPRPKPAGTQVAVGQTPHQARAPKAAPAAAALR